MKKIISILVFVFLISQLCAAQKATLLENSEHIANANFNKYLGVDEHHIYYQHTYFGPMCIIISDDKGNCIENKELGHAFDKVKDKMSYFFKYINFNGKLFLLYELVEKTQKESIIQKNYVKAETHTVYALEISGSMEADISKAIVLSKLNRDENKDYAFFNNTSPPLVYISEDSTKLAVFSFGHLTVLNEGFEKISESDIDFPTIPNNKIWGFDMCIFTGEKLLFVIKENDKGTVANGVIHYKILAYNIEDHQSKIIDIPSEKRLLIPTERIIWSYTNSDHTTIEFTAPCDNYRFQNGLLFIVGKVISEKEDNYITGLVYLNIDIEKTICKTKYITVGSEKYWLPKINTAGIKLCNDGSAMIYNNYFRQPNDTLECIKFDKDMNLIWRKKTATVEAKQNSYKNAGFCFVNNKLGFIYVKTSSGDMKNLVKVDFDEESGKVIEQPVYQYNQNDYEPNFVAFEALDANNLFLELHEKKTAKFLNVPF